MIRQVFGRRPGSCTACGADLDRGAVWCGGCGERVGAGAAPEPADAKAVHVAPEPPSEALATHAGGTGRRLTAVAVVAVVTLGVATVALRPTPPEALLGRVGVSTGVTATGLPSGDLDVAWVHRTGRADENAFQDVGPFVARDGLARVGGTVVDVATGEIVRIDTASSPRDPLAVRVTADELVLVDALTGRVVSRAPVPDGVDTGARPAARADGVTALREPVGTVLVADDGTVVSRHAALIYEGYADDAREDPASFPLRVHATGPDADQEGTGFWSDLVLVRASDGEVVLERQLSDDRDVLAADVVGDLGLLSTRGAQPTSSGVSTLWDVELVDVTSGAVLGTSRLESSDVPRILGRTATGGVYVGLRAGRQITVVRWGDDAVALVARVEAVHHLAGDDLYAGDSLVLRSTAVTDDGLLVLIEGGEVVARAQDGTVTWREDAGGAATVAIDDGLVALLPAPDPSIPTAARGVRLLSLADRSLATSFRLHQPYVHELAWRPFAVVGDDIGINAPFTSAFGATAFIHDTSWLDLRTGETSAAADVFSPWLGGDRSLRGAVLRGMIVDAESGVHRPLLTTEPRRDIVEVHEPEGVVTHELPLPDAAEVAGYFSEPVGATGDFLAASVHSYDGGRGSEGFTTYVIDRRDGSIVTVPGVLGHTLTDDALIGYEMAGQYWERGAQVAFDPATGDQLWASDDSSVRWGTRPRHDHEVLLRANDLGLSMLTISTGAQRWTHDAVQELSWLQPVLGDDAVLIATTDGTVIALDRDDGTERWRVDVGAPVLSLAGAGDGAVVGTLSGAVVLLDGSGAEVDRVSLAGPVQHVAAAGETVVASLLGEVVGLRTDTTGIVRRDEVELP